MVEFDHLVFAARFGAVAQRADTVIQPPAGLMSSRRMNSAALRGRPRRPRRTVRVARL